MFQELGNVLSGIKDSEGKSTGCTLRYFPAKAEFVQETEGSHIISINVTGNLKYRLGLTDNIIYPNARYKAKERGYMKAPGYFLIAEGVRDIRAAQYALFVYCDSVRPQIVGNTLTPILRTVSIRGKYGDIGDELYDNPHYIPLLKYEFSVIKINISHDRGRLVNFEYG